MSRFKPNRAGIVGLWDYACEVFHFADGRLVLRGPNGSGKTKALEVLFPFVLDGRMEARRLDPFSGEERSMKRNLLFHGQSSAHGYAWIEFVRRDGAAAEYVVVGVGMSARETASDVTPWFFVVDGAMGSGVDVVVDERPVTRKALTEAIGRENVYETAREHRRAVDRRLFGLEEERYDAMIDLVLMLRRPQLAKGLDPERLSDRLTEGLRPVDRELLVDSARAFEDLERVQRDVARLEQAVVAIDALVAIYGTYVGAQAASRGAAWAERDSDVVRATSLVAELNARVAQKTVALANAREALDSERRAQGERVARHQGLLDSADYRAIRSLDDLRRLAAAERESASRFEALRERHATAFLRAAGAAQRAGEELAASERTTLGRFADVRAAAAAAGLPVPEDREGANASVAARRIEVEGVLAHIVRHERAADDERRCRDVATASTDAEGRARSAVDAAESAREGERSAMLAAVGSWAVGVADEADRLALRAGIEGLGVDRVTSLDALVRDRWAGRRDALVHDRSSARARVGEHVARIASIASQIAAIAGEREDAPPRPAHRPAERASRPGAPLWRLVRFRDGVPEGERAAIEGALEAAGLLDAWLDEIETARPDGAADAFLRVGSPIDGPTLADVLVAEDSDRVPSARIDACLRSVPLAGSGEVAIGRDATFRLGPLVGGFTPDAARFVGATARASHRARRIAELVVARDAEEVGRAAAQVNVDRATSAIQGLEDALRTVPSSANFDRASVVVHKAAAAFATRREVAERDRSAAGEASRRALALFNVLRAEARRCDAPVERGALEALLERLVATRRAIELWSRAGEQEGSCRRADAQASASSETARVDAELATRHADEAEGKARAAEQRLSAVEVAQGEAAREVLRQVRDLERAIEQAKEEIEHTDADVRSGEKDLAKLDSDRMHAGIASARAESERATSRARLDVFGRVDVARVLGLEGADPGPTEALPRRLIAAVAGRKGTPEYLQSTRTQLLNRLQELDAAMGSEYRARWDVDDELIVVEIDDGETRRAAALFAPDLAERLRDQRALLSEREHDVFKDQLLDALCRQLHGRIGAARSMVASMDREMRARRTASDLTIGIRWRVDEAQGDGARAALKLLERDPRHLGAEALDAVRKHFAGEVERERRARPGAAFIEVLGSALDYRGWHRFELLLVDRAGKDEILTRRRYDALSGGEKSVALHLPLFAAANAYFSSARPTCPRLVALDEAFAGIDDTGTPELLALTVAFDLDLFLTGYDLWATEACLPAVAHYDLQHDRSAKAVSAWLVVWNGRETIEGDDALAAIDG